MYHAYADCAGGNFLAPGEPHSRHAAGHRIGAGPGWNFWPWRNGHFVGTSALYRVDALYSTRSSPAAARYLIVGASLLAPTLAGSTELWAMAILMALTGVIFVLFPPHRALPLFPTLIMSGLLLIALLAFLPADWSRVSVWRADLTSLGAILPSSRTPQPWITFQWTILLFLVLAWSYYLLASDWTRGERDRTLVIFAVGVLILGGLLVFAHVTGWRVPFWPDVPEFGFFPNRNQTSNVFGLAGIIIYALGFHRLQEHRPTWWVWLCSLSLICWALILNYSRSGIVLFFGGAIVWHSWWLFQARERRGPILALCAVALLFGVLLLNGGKTLARFQSPEELSPSNGRVQIFRDALHLSREAPLLGVGLGNFRPLFSGARHYSVSTSEAVHPESDWLWGAVELGWFAPALTLLAILWWLGRCFPFATGTGRALRVAALICGIAFAIHGLVDVSAHRLGTLWPALLMASLALYPERDSEASNLVSWIYRAFGVVLVAFAICWIASVAGAGRFPTTATVSRLEREVEQAVSQSDYQRAFEQANKGLALAPLDWLLYYHRGVAEAGLYHPRAEASRDFAIARRIFGLWPDLYLREGNVWLELGEPDLAFEIWKDGMQKLGSNAFILYEGISSVVRKDPELSDRWFDLAGEDPRCVLMALSNATPLEFSLQLDRLLTARPDLRGFSPSQVQTLFQIWLRSGDSLSLVEAAARNPDWQRIAFREVSRAYAGLQDYQQAYGVLAHYGSPAKLPDVGAGDVQSLGQRFKISADPGRDGLLLAVAEWRNRLPDDALRTITIASTSSRPPVELDYLASEIWAAKGDWQKAWAARAKYEKL